MITDDLRNHRPLVIEAQMDDDRIFNGRIFFDDASLFAQNGRAELMAPGGTEPQ